MHEGSPSPEDGPSLTACSPRGSTQHRRRNQMYGWSLGHAARGSLIYPRKHSQLPKSALHSGEGISPKLGRVWVPGSGLGEDGFVSPREQSQALREAPGAACISMGNASEMPNLELLLTDPLCKRLPGGGDAPGIPEPEERSPVGPLSTRAPPEGGLHWPEPAASRCDEGDLSAAGHPRPRGVCPGWVMGHQ